MSAWMGHARARLPRVAESVAERARLTVVPRRQPSAPRTPFVVLVAMVLLGGVVGLLLFNTSMQQASFRATALESEADQLHALEQSLQMRVDHLRNPQRVAVKAQQLGMVSLVNPAFIKLSDGTVLGDAAPASGLDRQRITPLPTPKPPSLRRPLVTVIADLAPDPRADGVPSDEPATDRGTTEAPE